MTPFRTVQMSAGFASIAAAIAVMVYMPEGRGTSMLFLVLFFAGDFAVWHAARAAKASREALANLRR